MSDEFRGGGGGGLLKRAKGALMSQKSHFKNQRGFSSLTFKPLFVVIKLYQNVGSQTIFLIDFFKKSFFE